MSHSRDVGTQVGHIQAAEADQPADSHQQNWPQYHHCSMAVRKEGESAMMNPNVSKVLDKPIPKEFWLPLTAGCASVKSPAFGNGVPNVGASSRSCRASRSSGVSAKVWNS